MYESNDYSSMIDSCYGLISKLGSRDFKIKPEHEPIRNLYAKKGFMAFSITPEIAKLLFGYFDPSLSRSFDVADFSPDYLSVAHNEDTIRKLNQDHIYFDAPRLNEPAPKVLGLILDQLRDPIEAIIGSPFTVVNVRAWITKHDAQQFGPVGWHKDGLSKFVRKVLIYPLPPNPNNGSIEVVGYDELHFTLNAETPVALVADVAMLVHRGIPPLERIEGLPGRPIIEVTFVPSIRPDINVKSHGQNARIPHFRLDNFIELCEMLGRIGKQDGYIQQQNEVTEKQVNIGGGKLFDFPGWLNFDAASPQVRSRFRFDSETSLPYATGSAELVYSSHCLEHLPDDTVARILQETFRILKPNGDFVVKIPDFDRILSEWIDREENGILNPDLWNVPSLYPIWKNCGIESSIERVTAMIFCGFWNDAYGDEFDGSSHALGVSPYHGPPRIEQSKTATILSSSLSPHFISSLLVEEVKRTERNAHFNHRNAWSRTEFIAMAGVFGFECINSESSVISESSICNDFKRIPTIEEMKGISSYFHFRKM
jgi:SAM-dependent methyltransferase